MQNPLYLRFSHRVEKATATTTNETLFGLSALDRLHSFSRSLFNSLSLPSRHAHYHSRTRRHTPTPMPRHGEDVCMYYATRYWFRFQFRFRFVFGLDFVLGFRFRLRLLSFICGAVCVCMCMRRKCWGGGGMMK